MMSKKLIAIIDLNEEMAFDYGETNGCYEENPVLFVENEFVWLEEAGISLSDLVEVNPGHDDTNKIIDTLIKNGVLFSEQEGCK